MKMKLKRTATLGVPTLALALATSFGAFSQAPETVITKDPLGNTTATTGYTSTTEPSSTTATTGRSSTVVTTEPSGTMTTETTTTTVTSPQPSATYSVTPDVVVTDSAVAIERVQVHHDRRLNPMIGAKVEDTLGNKIGKVADVVVTDSSPATALVLLDNGGNGANGGLPTYIPVGNAGALIANVDSPAANRDEKPDVVVYRDEGIAYVPTPESRGE